MGFRNKSQEEERYQSSDLLLEGVWTVRSVSKKVKESIEEEIDPQPSDLSAKD